MLLLFNNSTRGSATYLLRGSFAMLGTALMNGSVFSNSGISGGQNRTYIKFGWLTGDRESSPHALKRFTRLHWGIWLRPRAGHKQLWDKPKYFRDEKPHFVFTNKEQSDMLDILVDTKYRVKRYFPNDPLRYYHSREWLHETHVKPWPSKRHRLEKHHANIAELEIDWYKKMPIIKEHNYSHPVVMNNNTTAIITRSRKYLISQE